MSDDKNGSDEQFKLFDSVVRLSNDAIITKALDGTITSWNNASEVLFGFTSVEIIGKNISTIVPVELLAEEAEIVRKITAGEIVRHYETSRVRKDGRLIFVSITVSPLRNAQGAVIGASKIARDITSEKTGVLALEGRNTILESITDAFFAVDRNWVVTYWNNMAEKVLGRRREEIVGKDLWQVYKDSVESESYKEYHLAMECNRSVHFEDYYLPLDRWYDISAYPSGGGLSVYFKDITERKATERKLTELNEHLLRQARELEVFDVERKKRITELEESEKRYSQLFHLSPLPMWVIDAETLRFLDVNVAAVKSYGYSESEFLTMTINDISPAGQLSQPGLNTRDRALEEEIIRQGIYRHTKKNGEVIQADVLTNSIEFKGRAAEITVASDVTERLNQIKAIEEQNEKLMEIAWMQSHVVRAPLARIMGLINVINDCDLDRVEKEGILNHIAQSANELDEIIRNITNKSSR